MSSYLKSVIKQFEYYKSLGDRSFEFLNDETIHSNFNQQSNNIAIIVKHMVGNMLSRWTNFFEEDGEKEWRHRDREFEDSYRSKHEMISAWQKGWDCLFNAITPLTDEDLERIIYIRREGHTVTEAINRQMMHYAYHVGQIVYATKIIAGDHWKSLSIPKGKSQAFNQDKFNKKKS
ncbi:MAG: DUF1572 domain-containing protein [Flavobacteriaceae bacterium]|nr:MAG: DUF1572 domain-containing protein [Flavobacteriaceae bacterium]